MRERSLMMSSDLHRLCRPPADHRVAYGPAPQQFGELRLPEGPGPHPVVIVIHGGCWQAQWGLDHVRTLCAALAADRLATWSLEYRRIGDSGGGWPGTFEDVSQGVDHLRGLAAGFPISLDRVAVLGHSAGGHLALWVAGRRHLPETSPLLAVDPLPLRGVVSLAGITDLRAAAEQNVCEGAVIRLLGGSTAEHSERLRQISPIEMLPLGVPQRLIRGALDSVVPLEQVESYAAAARKAGDSVETDVLPEAGHFELIDPTSRSWPAVSAAVRALF